MGFAIFSCPANRSTTLQPCLNCQRQKTCFLGASWGDPANLRRAVQRPVIAKRPRRAGKPAAVFAPGPPTPPPTSAVSGKSVPWADAHNQHGWSQRYQAPQAPAHPRGAAGTNGTGPGAQETAKTGRPNDAANPATASEPGDAGRARKNTQAWLACTAAQERRNNRARRGTDSGPPARNATEVPVSADASTVSTADPDHAPTPDEENAANTNTGTASRRQARRVRRSAPTAQPVTTDAPCAPTAATNRATTGAKAGDNARDPPKSTGVTTATTPTSQRPSARGRTRTRRHGRA